MRFLSISSHLFAPIPVYWFVPFIALLTASCQGPMSKELSAQQSEFNLKTVGKADVDMFADVSMHQSMEYLRLLAAKLYRRNPKQLPTNKDHRLLSKHQKEILAQQRIEQIFAGSTTSAINELNNQRSVTAIRLAFDESYTGDRVAAFISGLRDMLLDTYSGDQDFYLYHEFDAQKIYNLARNFEVAFWKLNHDKDANGRPFLLGNATGSESSLNLSFERLYGKLIAIQDQMAVVIANTTNRRIKNIIQGAASMVFLPI